MFAESLIFFTYRGGLSGWNSSTDPADAEMMVRAEVAATTFSLGLAGDWHFPTSRMSLDDEGTGVSFMEDPVLLEETAFAVATEEADLVGDPSAFTSMISSSSPSWSGLLYGLYGSKVVSAAETGK